MTLSEAREGVGRAVVYEPFKGCDQGQLEYGMITSVNERVAFVRYGSDKYSKATAPEDLRFDYWG